MGYEELDVNTTQTFFSSSAEFFVPRFHSTKYISFYLIYLCPLSGIGTPPTPLPQASVPPPPEPKGGAHSPAGRGWGSPNSDDWRKAYHSAYSVFHRFIFEKDDIWSRHFKNHYLNEKFMFLVCSPVIRGLPKISE